MKMDLETARSLAYYANWAIESNADDKVEAISSARLFATDAYPSSITKCSNSWGYWFYRRN